MTLSRIHFIVFLLGLSALSCCFFDSAYAQSGVSVGEQVVADTIVAPDSISRKDSTATGSKNAITEIVEYQANDSLVFMDGNTGLLYGNGDVTYGKLNLNAGFIRMSMDSSVLYATGRPDTTGSMVENPVFKDASGEYKSETLRYNFKSKKGVISQVVTQQGEGYVVSGHTKKLANDEMCMVNGKYTTCDNHDHPHFYLDLSKAKVKPGSYIVSGPAHLVIEDVHLPLVLPFGYFPFKGNYSSGLLSPTYGDELSRGFYLKDGGYYFAISDYMDLALTGELYSKGSWGVDARSTYRVRYKYSGSFYASYLETVTSEKNLPDYAKAKNLSITWSHSQDTKANPYRTFSASVNFQTSGYRTSNLNTYYDPKAFSSNTKSSSVNFTQRFPESPFSFSTSMNVSQRSSDSTLSVSLPSLSVNMSSINPLKRKNSVGKERWYERIRMSYTGSFSNSIGSVKEKDFLNQSLIKDWKNGIRHSIPLSATFNMLNYINITPNVSYTERWYSSAVNRSYDEKRKKEVADTTWGFHRVWDYSTGMSFSTTLYGMFQPSRRLFGDKVNMIRHVLTPSVSLSYIPDFGASRYGYYGSYSYWDESANEMEKVVYSHYINGLYGTPGREKSGSIGFNIANNLEMKVKQVNDTATIFKKVSLIDNFSFGSSYNMAVDSLNWSNISTNLRLKFGSKSVSLSGAFDPYTYVLDSKESPVRVNRTQFQKYGIPGRLISTSTSFNYTLSNETFKKKNKQNGVMPAGRDSVSGEEVVGKEAGASQGDVLEKPVDPEAAKYAPFKLPWSVNFSYSLSYVRSTFDKKRLEYNHTLSQNLGISGNISLTDNWRMNASTTYNFQRKKLTTMNCSVTRDLHCWEMSASFIPVGPYKSYNFSVRVKSSLLQDLKYQQHQNPNDNRIWGY